MNTSHFNDPILELQHDLALEMNRRMEKEKTLEVYKVRVRNLHEKIDSHVRNLEHSQAANTNLNQAVIARDAELVKCYEQIDILYKVGQKAINERQELANKLHEKDAQEKRIVNEFTGSLVAKGEALDQMTIAYRERNSLIQQLKTELNLFNQRMQKIN